MAGGIEINANSVQFQLKLPVGTELGKSLVSHKIDSWSGLQFISSVESIDSIKDAKSTYPFR